MVGINIILDTHLTEYTLQAFYTFGVFKQSCIMKSMASRGETDISDLIVMIKRFSQC